MFAWNSGRLISSNLLQLPFPFNEIKSQSHAGNKNGLTVGESNIFLVDDVLGLRNGTWTLKPRQYWKAINKNPYKTRNK